VIVHSVRRMLVSAGLALAGLCVLPAGPAPATEPKVETAWRAFKGLPVAGFRIAGVTKELKSDLEAGLALTGRRRWLGTERAPFFPETLAEDVERARLFLARNGYPDAVVEGRVTPASGGNAAEVVIAVQPGPVVRIGVVSVRGVPEDLSAPATGLLPGQPLRDADVSAAEVRIAGALRERGHAFARVEAGVGEIRPEGDTRIADVRLVATAGPRYRIAEVRVEGASADLADLARVTVGLRAGDPYSPARLRDAESALRELDLFRLVRLQVEPASPTGNGLILRCELAERLPRTLSIGVGYFSDDQVRGNAEWRHRNLLGGGRGVVLGGQASRFLQSLRADVGWPRFFGRRTRALAGIAFRRESEDAYQLWDSRFDFAATRRLTRFQRITAGVSVGYIDLVVRTDDPRLDDPVGILTTLPVSWIRDSSDHPVVPTSGRVIRAGVEFTPPGLGSVANYLRTEIAISNYQAIGPTVLASRVLAGAVRPLRGSSSVLASRRLFAGGSRSMRGFGRRRLGPQDDEGEALGAEAKLEAASELRFPILGLIEGAAFVDAGQAWGDRDALRLQDLEWAVGPALMLRSPVGPLRIDWGFLLTPVDGEPSSVLHFSVGHPY
jgi:outer membrane protein assembly factor BamA